MAWIMSFADDGKVLVPFQLLWKVFPLMVAFFLLFGLEREVDQY